MSKTKKFSVKKHQNSFGSELPEFSPFTKILREIILEIAVERNTPYEISFTLEELRERFIAKGYDPETGEKINQNDGREAGQ